MSKKDIKFSVLKSKNGIKILNFYDRTTKRAGIEFLTKSSTSTNPKGKEGLAHFTEHLLARQSKSFPDPITQAVELEKIGAHKSAHTGHFETSYSVNGGSSDFSRLAYILADMATRPHVTEESLASERSIIEKEIARNLANESRHAYDKLMEIFASNSPMVYGNLGTKKALDKITIKDITKYVKTNYLVNNSMIVTWGGVADKIVKKCIDDNFSRLQESEWKDPEFEFVRDQNSTVSFRDSHEVNILLAFRLENNAKEIELSNFVKAALARGWTSRISSRLRLKESLIYRWGSSSSSVKDTASLTISVSTSSESCRKVLKVLREELLKFVEKPISIKELKHVKDKITKPFAWAIETSGNYASWYADQYFYHPESIISPEEYMERIKNISSNQIHDFSEKYINDSNWYLSIVGPVKDKDVEFDLKIN